MHTPTPNSTCILKCLQRGTECPVINKCHMIYAMYSNPPMPTHTTEHTRLNWTFSSYANVTPIKYLKCDLSLPFFQSEWLLWHLHWKVAGLVNKQTAIESYFSRSKLYFFCTNFIWPINGTKEANIIWAYYYNKMARPSRYFLCTMLFDHKRPNLRIRVHYDDSIS